MAESITEHHLELAREPHIADLDPTHVLLIEDGSGKLRLTIEGDRSYVDVKVVRAFPFSDPDHFWAFMGVHDKVIAMLEEPTQLTKPSRSLAMEYVRRHYFIPAIKKVVSFREEYGAVYLDVETDAGPRHFVSTGMRDAIRDLGEGELLIADVDGNRFRIENWMALDIKSRQYLECVV